jgi:hypothetical protein
MDSFTALGKLASSLLWSRVVPSIRRTPQQVEAPPLQLGLTLDAVSLKMPQPMIFISRLVGILALARGEYPTPRNLPSSGERVTAEET